MIRVGLREAVLEEFLGWLVACGLFGLTLAYVVLSGVLRHERWRREFLSPWRVVETMLPGGIFSDEAPQGHLSNQLPRKS